MFLITGGAGSLGLEIANALIMYEPKAIRLFDNNENGIFWAEQKYKHVPFMRYFLGDIKNHVRVRRAMEDVDICVHAAAVKHVHIGELNPTEVLDTNVIGTQNCINVALDEYGVQSFIFISSDKAVNPINIYGASKLMGEKLTLNANKYKGDRPTAFTVCRPANYLRSSGSVYELWERQKEQNQPLSVTHPEMRRYFMPMHKMVDFIFKVIQTAKGGETFIPICEEFSVLELAQKVSPKIKFTGLRAGERLREELYSEEEKQRMKKVGDIWVIKE